MTARVAINGFGRIGRMVLRAILETERTDIEVVAINDLADLKTSAMLMQYDSVHGKFPGTVSAENDALHVNGKEIKFYQERNPADLPWGDLGIDVVMECSGVFRDREGASKHIAAGARKVLISAPAIEEDKTVVYGVNHNELTADDLIVSNASCTTNCLAPVAHVLNEAVGITHGFMTTVHAYTGDQNIIDSYHKDLARARAAAMNMIPTSTGAAKAVGKVLPALNGKLDGVAVRVPTANVSMIDFTFVASKSTSVEEINNAIKAAADKDLKGVLGYYAEPLVSSDFNHDAHSSVFGLNETAVMDGTLVRVLSWYDNEWGFSNRMSDTAVLMSAL